MSQLLLLLMDLLNLDDVDVTNLKHTEFYVLPLSMANLTKSILKT